MSTGNLFVRRALLGLALAAFAAVPSAFADPTSPINVSHVDSPDPVVSGGQLTYTTTITNTGGANVTNVSLTNQVNGVGGIGVPPQLVLTSTRGSCTQNVNLVTCNAGNIEGRGTWTVTIRGVVTASSGTTLNNTVGVTGTKSAQTFNTTTTTTTLVSGGAGQLPDLTIHKTGPTTVTVNSPMTYTLTVNNIGTLPTSGVTVVDTVPAGLTGISASGTSLFTCGVVGQTVTCTGGLINQGSNGTITINATAPAAPGTITNNAVVDPDNAIVEINDLNNTSALVNTQVTTGPPAPDLTINLTDDSAVIAGAGPDPVNPGATLTYKILVTNTHPTRADDVEMVNGTQGLEAASITVTQEITDGTEGQHGGCEVLAPQVRCRIQKLQPGGTVLYTIRGQVVASAGSTILDTATVTGNIQNTGVSSTDTELTTVKPDVDLTIVKTDGPDPVCARSWPANPAPAAPPLLGPPVCLGGLTYTMVVGNSGINPAIGVTVRDPLPMGTVLDSFVAPNFFGGCAVNPATNVLTCTGGLVGPESVTTITVVLVAPPFVGTISNTATVDPNNAIFEADETNNTDTESTLVSTGIDLTILKTDVAPGHDPIATNGTQTYTITVDNIGTQDATNIRVRDTLPANTRFRSAVADNGFSCSHSNGVVECFGGSILGTAAEFYAPFGAPGNDTATIIIRVFAQPNVGTGVDGMHNEVRVDPLNEIAEVNEANNIDFEDTDVVNGGGGAFNQLTIAKTQVSPANPVARNAVVTYNIAIGNTGSDQAVGVAVRDFLPAGARYISATGASFLCTEHAAFVECVGGLIPAAGTVNITLTAFAPDTPGTYTNQAVVDPLNTVPEGDETDNESSVQTVVENGGNGAFNDLRVDKTGSPTAVPGGSISYTLQVTNNGTNAAQNVTVRDILPAGVTFVSAEDSAPGAGAFSCTQSAGVIDCTGGNLAAGGVPRLINIEVTAPNTTVVLTNQAIVDPGNAIPEGDEANNTDTFDTTVSSVINLKITKTGPNSSSQSTVADYVIKVKNEPLSGSPGQTAFGVKVHDPLPVGVIPLAVNAGGGNNFACQIAENPINVVDCLGDLNPDQEVTITITVFMTAESGRSLDNEACVDPDDEIEEYTPPGEGDNCSTHSISVGPPPKRSPDILVNKGADQATTSPGSPLTYTISVSNIGTANAVTPVTVSDNLPADVTFIDANATNGWNCTEALGTITCDDAGSGLAMGASTQITVHVTVSTTANLPIANTAVAAPALADLTEGDTEHETAANIPNNSSTVVTSVGGSAFDLAIASISDNPDPVNRAASVTYTIVAVNGGTAPANGVNVSIALPPVGVTLMGADGTNGFNCGAPVASVIDCEGDLPANGDTTITVTLLVNLGAPDDLNLTATIDPAGEFSETDEGNNSETEVTTVSGDTCTNSPCIDLVSAQIVENDDPVQVGGTLTYDFVLVNVGDSPTTLDPTPGSGEFLNFFDLFGNFTFVSRTSSNPAVTCVTNPGSTPGSNLLTDCSGNLLAGQGVTISITVTPLAAGNISAVGTADPGGLINEFLETNNVVNASTTINP